MDSALFLSGESLSALVGYVGQYAGAGVGIGVISWLLGYVIWFVIDLLRGGV